jgi:hypothetical protein
MQSDLTTTPTNFHRASKSEAIVARATKHSVSHFIDCDPAAHRLRASLIASRDAADQIGKTQA